MTGRNCSLADQPEQTEQAGFKQPVQLATGPQIAHFQQYHTCKSELYKSLVQQFRPFDAPCLGLHHALQRQLSRN